MLNKISNISIIVLIAGFILEMFYPMFSILTIGASCLLYVCILLKNKRAKGKIDTLLLFVCSLSLVWILLREFTTFPYVSWLGWLVLILQGVLIFKTLDPILENIALQHREKREKEQIVNE